MSRYRFIDAERANFPVRVLCKVLGVLRSGYYDWKTRPPSKRSPQNAALTGKIREIHQPAVAVYVGQGHISGTLSQTYRRGHLREAPPLIVVIDAKALRRDQEQVLPAVLVEIAQARWTGTGVRRAVS